MAPDRSTVIVNEPPMAGPCWLRASMEAVLALPHDAIGISCAHGIHMRTFSCLSFIGPTAAALLSLLPLPVRAATPDHSVFRIEVVAGARISEGTCVLVQQENRDGDSVLYFLASARLFTGGDVQRGTEPRRVRILRDGSTAIDIVAANILLPPDQEADVAVIRVVAARGTLAPMPLVFELPQPGRAFIVEGFGTSGLRLTVPQRVRYGSSTALVVEGDRAGGTLAACVGAPAIVEDGVFGLVNACPTGTAPSIALLSNARRFISDNVPGLDSNTAAPPAFTLFTREVSRPLRGVQREAQQNGDVDVPIELGPRELALEASASITDARTLHLADVPVVSMRDRSVTLRLTMTGTPLPPFATTAGPNPKNRTRWLRRS